MADIADRAARLEDEQRADALARFAQRNALRAAATHCGECGERIPKARRAAVKNCNTCIDCQEFLEKLRARTAQK